MSCVYTGPSAEHIAFPVGGLGSGCFCIDGNGAFSHVSFRHRPNLNFEPNWFAALALKPGHAKVLEGPVPDWKIFGKRGNGIPGTSSNGLQGTTFGLPRFRRAEFRGEFPACRVSLRDPDIPLAVELEAGSPFVAGSSDATSLPVAWLRYRFTNPSEQEIDGAVFSFHASNFMRTPGGGNVEVLANDSGFVLGQVAGADAPHEAGWLAVESPGPEVSVDAAWFRGGWFDELSVLWEFIAAARARHHPPPADESGPSPGASLYVSLPRLQPGGETEVLLLISWYVPLSDVTANPGGDKPPGPHRPWVGERFEDHRILAAFWRENHHGLIKASEAFSAEISNLQLPPMVEEAVRANLSIMKSPTFLRTHDGRLWGYEGCCTAMGCCDGNCTHVYNSAQVFAELFPDLERGFRQTEFYDNQRENGEQFFRAALPIRQQPCPYPALDGQFGGIMKVWRDWKFTNDTAWLRSIWPRVRQAFEYGINRWDPDRRGVCAEEHHVTFDIEFYGPNPYSACFYIGALAAACEMASALREAPADWHVLHQKAVAQLEEDLFNGEYFYQRTEWTGMRSLPPESDGQLAEWKPGYASPEARALLRAEGPKYQYGPGILSNALLGLWLADTNGLAHGVDREKIRSHLLSVFRYNFRRGFWDHPNPQRSGYAMKDEAGLLLCSWPRGGRPMLPFVYSDEVWTGIEYEVASYLALLGHQEEALQLVEATRARYDGRRRNPFAEYECGLWYVRALASWNLIAGFKKAGPA